MGGEIGAFSHQGEGSTSWYIFPLAIESSISAMQKGLSGKKSIVKFHSSRIKKDIPIWENANMEKSIRLYYKSVLLIVSGISVCYSKFF